MIRNVRIVAHNCPVRLKNKAGFFLMAYVFLYNVCARMVRSDENRKPQGANTRVVFTILLGFVMCSVFMRMKGSK